MKVLLAATVVVIMSATTYRSFYIDADFSKWSEILNEKFTEVRSALRLQGGIGRNRELI